MMILLLNQDRLHTGPYLQHLTEKLKGAGDEEWGKE